MANIFVISDTHFGHSGIITFKKEDGSPLRNFESVEEMDELEGCMGWEQKFQAMQALLIFKANASLHMRSPGDWYVALPGVSLKKEHILEGVSGSGATPEVAVNSAWVRLTVLQPGEYLITRSTTSPRKAIKWNGFMWEDVTEEK
jgi:hypothetical protein